MLALEGTGIGLMIGAVVAIYTTEPADVVGALLVAVLGLVCFVSGEAMRR